MREVGRKHGILEASEDRFQGEVSDCVSVAAFSRLRTENGLLDLATQKSSVTLIRAVLIE